MRKGGIVLSGGPDSAVAAWDTLRPNNDAYTLPDVEWQAFHFTYGQLAVPEYKCAQEQARILNIPLTLIQLPEGLLTSTMTSRSEHRAADDIEPTFVPGRNALFIYLTLSRLYHRGDPLVVVGGWNAADAAGYPDCRSSFITALAFSAEKAFDCEVTISSPVIDLQKEEIILKATELGIPLHQTWSCYTPNFVQPGKWIPCGKCVSCELREKGFRKAGLVDPLVGVNDEP